MHLCMIFKTELISTFFINKNETFLVQIIIVVRWQYIFYRCSIYFENTTSDLINWFFSVRFRSIKQRMCLRTIQDNFSLKLISCKKLIQDMMKILVICNKVTKFWPWISCTLWVATTQENCCNCILSVTDK